MGVRRAPRSSRAKLFDPIPPSAPFAATGTSPIQGFDRRDKGGNMTGRLTGNTETAKPLGTSRQYALTVSAIAIALAAAFGSGHAAAVGRLGNLDIVTRGDGQVLPVYPSGGRNWVVGAPGQEYSIRFCNTTPGRVLAVMSVDGVNVISGDTASPSQSGYVLNGYECADINGWRKNMSRTAAFYFTELPDAYATRTGRPENVGVIGVAVFRERPPAVTWRGPPGKVAEGSRDRAAANAPAPAAGGLGQDSLASSESATRRQEAAGMVEADAKRSPAPTFASKLGTGHGRSEDSPAQMVRFERESATPSETIAIHYDRRENLVAMGILPPPVIARTPNPFPAWPHFVPDPPNR